MLNTHTPTFCNEIEITTNKGKSFECIMEDNNVILISCTFGSFSPIIPLTCFQNIAACFHSAIHVGIDITQF